MTTPGATYAPREPVSEFAAMGIVAFTTTRAAGDFNLSGEPVEPANVDRWASLQAALAPQAAGLVSSVQVHGVQVAVHRSAWDGVRRLDGLDGHIVADRGAAAVTVADCVPVFIAHATGVVAVVHAGWRGVATRILPAAIERMGGLGCAPAALHVHLGPAICGRCYEVGPDVYERLTGWSTTRSRHVDLRALLAEQAKVAGVERVSASAWCTRCDNDRFYSHRAGDAGRQVAVIVAGDIRLRGDC